jgi:origin recognition complex subunit 5
LKIAKGDANDTFDGKCESLSALAVHLSKLLHEREENFVVVFDSVDLQREAPPTLFAALGRLGELVGSRTAIQ